MPRGKKQKAVVLIHPDEGHIIKHCYHYNHRHIEKDKAFKKVYDPKTRQRVVPKVKDERHAT